MAQESVRIDEFLKIRHDFVLIDVRSESEFQQGHVLGAINIPILNNEERAIVGTLYKKSGSQKAVIRGFELVGPRFHLLVEESIKLAQGRPILIYCWRGGMRSEIFSWLLQTAGLKVKKLQGGYKKYRAKTYQKVRENYNFIVLGGRTGCGKTEILNQLSIQGKQVVDLEALANHKGSVFGGISMPAQHSNEQFENLLAEQLFNFNANEPVWIENESQLIGKIIVPNELVNQIRTAPLIDIELSVSKRYERIEKEYSQLPVDELILATRKLEKRLGNLRMRQAITAMENGDTETWIKILMQYYDKGYDHSLAKSNKERMIKLDISEMDIKQIVTELLQIKSKLLSNGTN